MTPVHQLEFILCLLLAILLLTLAARRLGLPPAAAFILGGAALALVPGVPELELDPDLVIVLFLPPLLMSSAYFTVWQEFRANLGGILLLAVGAVAFTTLLVGLVAHALVPSLPWAVCFALGAVVSPPDAVAAEAVLERLHLPDRLSALLRGESLLNDAAGLVLFRFAVAAALTGSFSVGEAAAAFGWLAVSGIAAGALLGWLGTAMLRRLGQLGDPLLVIVATLLLPWASYIGAELLHGSGVLATVTCGLILGRVQHGFLRAATRTRAEAFWRVMVFLLESLVFILIGLSLRGVLARMGGAADAAEALLLPVLGIVLAVVVSRFLWVYASDLVRQVAWRVRRDRVDPPSFRAATVMGWAGMRGVVTLAAALSLPEALPGRDFVLLASFCVILVTVLVQGGTLGLLIRRLGLDREAMPVPGQLTEDQAWSRMAQVQLAAVQAASRQPDGTERHPRLLEQYTYRATIGASYAEDAARHRPHEIEHFTLVLETVRAGREEILRLHRAGEIHDRVLNALERELDLQEMVAELYRDG